MNEARTAFQPEYDQINAQTNLENGIISKQRADNQYYLQWLNTKASALQGQQAQVDQTTSNLENQLSQNQLSDFGAQAQDMTAAANARPGNVSNNANAFTPGASANADFMGANRQAMEEQFGGAAQSALASEETAQSALGGAVANSAAVVAAGGAREETAYQTAMSKLATATTSVSDKQAAFLEKEIARLQGVQISLTENNRNYNTAVAKLGLQAAATNSLIASRAASTRLQQAKFSESVKQNQFNDWVKNQQLGQNAEKIAISLANSDSLRALRNAEIAAKANGGALSHASQNTLYNKIQETSGELQTLISQNGLSPHEAYAAVMQGYWVTSVNGKTKTIRVPRMSNQSLLNAAFNTRQGGGGLTPGDMKYLTQLGLTDIGSRLTVASTRTNVGNAAGGVGSQIGGQLGW